MVFGYRTLILYDKVINPLETRQGVKAMCEGRFDLAEIISALCEYGESKGEKCYDEDSTYSFPRPNRELGARGVRTLFCSFKIPGTDLALDFLPIHARIPKLYNSIAAASRCDNPLPLAIREVCLRIIITT